MSSQQPSLAEFMASCQTRVNELMQQQLEATQPSDRLRKAMSYACLQGGKRLRPVLVYGAVAALEAPRSRGDMAACAVEFLHSYSLAHDDLPAMDDDDLRRGKPSLHCAFDEATAILAGDALQSLAFECLSKPGQELSASQCLEMLHCLSAAVGPRGMVGGQSLDFEAVGQASELTSLEALHRLKTGALIRASVMLGAMAAGCADANTLQRLGRYGEQLGLAFQVQDDILDHTGDTETLGKPQGSDRARDKPTYVSLLGVEAAQRLAGELINEAVAELRDFSAGANPLRELASYVVARNH